MSKYGPEKESKSEDGTMSQAKYLHTTNTQFQSFPTS